MEMFKLKKNKKIKQLRQYQIRTYSRRKNAIKENNGSIEKME